MGLYYQTGKRDAFVQGDATILARI
jgi:hypothetical protein